MVAGIISQAMAETSSDLDAVRNRTRRPTGDIIAPPTPCSMRAATSSGRFCDRPHRIEPRVNRPIAARNTVRLPNRSAILPLAGMNIARVSR